MKILGALLFAMTAILAPSVVCAAPPPPPPPPPGVNLGEPIGGYDLQIPYFVWNYWVRSRQGVVADQMLAQPLVFDGEQAIGPPFLTFKKYDDFGHFLSGDVQVFCQSEGEDSSKRRDCHYVLRRAYVPEDKDRSIVSWVSRSFDAAALAKHLREKGFSPDTDWWKADRPKLFETMPSPIPFLAQEAEVVRLDSRDCPAMDRAVRAADRANVTFRVDITGVGRDATPFYPIPHTVTAQYVLRTSVGGSPVTLEADAPAFRRIIAPLLDAADACEAKGAGKR